MKTYTTHDIKNVVLLGASGSGQTPQGGAGARRPARPATPRGYVFFANTPRHDASRCAESGFNFAGLCFLNFAQRSILKNQQPCADRRLINHGAIHLKPAAVAFTDNHHRAAFEHLHRQRNAHLRRFLLPNSPNAPSLENT